MLAVILASGFSYFIRADRVLIKVLDTKISHQLEKYVKILPKKCFSGHIYILLRYTRAIAFDVSRILNNT